MLVKLFVSVAAVVGLMLSGAGNDNVVGPTANAKPCAAVCCESGSCPLAAGAEGCCMDGDCCPDCPLCCGGSTATASAKAAKSKPAVCGSCDAGSKCCVK